MNPQPRNLGRPGNKYFVGDADSGGCGCDRFGDSLLQRGADLLKSVEVGLVDWPDGAQDF